MVGAVMRRVLPFVVLCVAICNDASAQSSSFLKLWYNRPATEWVEALPIGNGRLGAMVYGDPYKETIQLNEITVWGGQPNRNDNPDAREALPEIRKLVFDGKYKEAQDLVNQKVISRISQGMPYQTVGNLHLLFPGHENYTDYNRDLDIEKAIQTTRYRVDGVNYKSTVFASFPDQVIIVRITADKPGSINVSATMDRPAAVTISTKSGDELIMSGVTGDCDSVKGNVKFQAHVKIVTEGGSVSAGDTAVWVSNADVATLYISIASSFRNYADIGADAGAKAGAYLQNVVKKNYEQAFIDHITAYQKFFNRVSIDLGVTDSVKNPTDVRIARLRLATTRSWRRSIFSLAGIFSSHVPSRADNLQHCRDYGTINCIPRGTANTQSTLIRR